MTPRFLSLAGVVLAAALFRLLPHPPNFTPIGAMALFAGAAFADRRAAFLAPLAAMAISDLFLGFTPVTPVIYACIALGTLIGLWVRQHRSAGRILAGALASSVIFFVVTNFAVWAVYDMYPKTAAGLAACYIAAIPFFQNTLAGDLFFSAALFGGLWLAERRFAWMRETPAPSSAVAG